VRLICTPYVELYHPSFIDMHVPDCGNPHTVSVLAPPSAPGFTFHENVSSACREGRAVKLFRVMRKFMSSAEFVDSNGAHDFSSVKVGTVPDTLF
jgi:hypothetical protein